MRLRFCWGWCLGEEGKQMHWDEGCATVMCRRAVITFSRLISRAALGTACWVFFQLSPDANDCSACVLACQRSRLMFPANSVHLCQAGINETTKNCRVHLVVPFLTAAPLVLFAECCCRAVQTSLSVVAATLPCLGHALPPSLKCSC